MLNNNSTQRLIPKPIILAISTIVLGILVGCSSVLLSLFLGLIEHLFMNFHESLFNPSPDGTLPIRRLISVVVGGFIAALIWYWLRNKAKQGPVGINAALKGANMPAAAMIIHTITQIFYVGTGGSVGRELAPREAGAMIANKWNQLLEKTGIAQLDDETRRLLIASAAGAGFAGVYIAPITGMLFAVEILLKNVSLRTVSVSLTMSVIAMLIGSLDKGFTPYYFVTDTKFSITILPFVIIIGPIAGIIGAYFRKACQWAEKNQTHSKHVLWQLPLASLVTGIIAMTFLPQIMGNGRALAQLSISSTGVKMIWFLLIAAILKAVITVATIRSGVAGGTLTPSIAIGAALGAIVGPLFFHVDPQQGDLIGAVTLLSASQQAPLMALFMIIEVTHLGSNAYLPLGLGVALAVAFSQLILKTKKN